MRSTSLMSRSPRRYSEDGCWEFLPLARVADRGHALHHPEIGLDDPRAVAAGHAPSEFALNKSGLHTVRLREGGADRVEQPGVGGGIAPPRSADRPLIDGQPHPRVRRPSRDQ